MTTRFASHRSLPLLCTACCLVPGVARAQISLTTAVDLALRNDPHVHVAVADVAKATAALAETKDVFIPSVTTSGGYGKSAGVPLGLPVIFTIESRSLVYSASQRDYIRAAHAGLNAAEEMLAEARSATVEDTVNTYVALNNAERRQQVLREQNVVAARLVTIADERVRAGIDARVDLLHDQRTATATRLEQVTVDDEADELADHLARLTGLPAASIRTDSASIPALLPPALADDATDEAPGIAASLAQAQAQAYTAHGESRYILRPQVGLAAGYSRITVSNTESNYGVYYPAFTSTSIEANHLSLNALSVGFQISLPLLDYLHRARAREASADAAHSYAQAAAQRMQFLEGRHKLHRTAEELQLHAQLAELDSQLAEEQLAAVEAHLTAAAGSSTGPQMSPEDEAKARLDLGSHRVDSLNADLQLHQAEISLMRQNGTLRDWLGQLVTPSEPGATSLQASPPVSTLPSRP